MVPEFPCFPATIEMHHSLPHRNRRKDTKTNSTKHKHTSKQPRVAPNFPPSFLHPSVPFPILLTSGSFSCFLFFPVLKFSQCLLGGREERGGVKGEERFQNKRGFRMCTHKRQTIAVTTLLTIRLCYKVISGCNPPSIPHPPTHALSTSHELRKCQKSRSFVLTKRE